MTGPDPTTDGQRMTDERLRYIEHMRDGGGPVEIGDVLLLAAELSYALRAERDYVQRLEGK